MENQLLREYGHQDIKMKILGEEIYGLRKLQYTVKDNKKFFYGNGKYAVSYGRDGNYEVTGTLTILHSEFLGLQSRFEAGKSFTDLAPTNILITYEDENTGQSVTDLLEGVFFDEISKESSEGASGMEIPLAFKARKIVLNYQ